MRPWRGRRCWDKRYLIPSPSLPASSQPTRYFLSPSQVYYSSKSQMYLTPIHDWLGDWWHLQASPGPEAIEPSYPVGKIADGGGCPEGAHAAYGSKELIMKCRIHSHNDKG